MSRSFHPIAFLLLVFWLLGCSLLSLGTSNTAPTITPNGPQILFQDDFSNPQSGWDRVDAPEGLTDYQDGAYRILVRVPDTQVWANPGLNLDDVRIEVEATMVGGSVDNVFGVLCRYQDVDNYYALLISSDGYYGIVKSTQGDLQLLSGESMDYSDAILQGEATNHIQAECVGHTLRLSVNGVPLAEVQDNAFASGDVGLLAGAFSAGGTDILFDNFVVYRP